MNERAANSTGRAGTGPLAPIWHLDRERALFIGPLGRNDAHVHSVPVLLAGVYGAFRLKVGGDRSSPREARWTMCEAAVIPAGVSYEFDLAGDVLSVLYLEPGAGGAGMLTPLVDEGCEQGRVVRGRCVAGQILRSLYEARDGAASAGEALDELLLFSKTRENRALDARIGKAVVELSRGTDDQTTAGEAARRVGLSSSRFQHLFAEEMGVPFRRFRGWQRLRRAIVDIAGGASFTRAAHAAGFADQAHFSRAFRQTFGAPASPSLKQVRRAPG